MEHTRASRAAIWLPYLLYAKARACLLPDGPDSEEAYAALKEARAYADTSKLRHIQWRVLAMLARMENQRGNAAEAESLRVLAREVIAYLADHAGDPDLRASLLALPEVRALAGS